MAKETIMLCCAAGMSTSLLVKKMQDAAAAEGKDAEIFAVSASEADQQLDTKDIDCVLLGPQVRYMESDFKKKLAGRKNGADIPLAIIDMRSYGMMDGKTVLAQADKLING